MRHALAATRLVLALASTVVGCAADGDAPEHDASDAGDTTHDPATDVASDTSGDGASVDADAALDTADAARDTRDGADAAAPSDALDAGDAGDALPAVPLAGFGAISGACGVIDGALDDPAPDLFANAIDFADDPYDPEDFDHLTPWGQEVLTDGNAGGSSIMSEVFAMEVLARCERATLVATETEIAYDVEGKMTDLLVDIEGTWLGVSVTRAVGFPFDAPYTAEQARDLLEDKLADILESTANVAETHRWDAQILAVIAYADGHAAQVEAAWAEVDAALRADTIVVITVTDGDDAFLY